MKEHVCIVLSLLFGIQVFVYAQGAETSDNPILEGVYIKAGAGIYRSEPLNTGGYAIFLNPSPFYTMAASLHVRERGISSSVIEKLELSYSLGKREGLGANYRRRLDGRIWEDATGTFKLVEGYLALNAIFLLEIPLNSDKGINLFIGPGLGGTVKLHSKGYFVYWHDTQYTKDRHIHEANVTSNFGFTPVGMVAISISRRVNIEAEYYKVERAYNGATLTSHTYNLSCSFNLLNKRP